MIDINEFHMDLGEIEYADGKPVTHEAVIFFPALFDSPEIRVNAPDAGAIARRIADLWNKAAAALTSD